MRKAILLVLLLSLPTAYAQQKPITAHPIAPLLTGRYQLATVGESSTVIKIDTQTGRTWVGVNCPENTPGYRKVVGGCWAGMPDISAPEQ